MEYNEAEIVKQHGLFNEDEHNEKIMAQEKQKGESFNKLLKKLFPWKDTSDFNPVLLTDEEYIEKAKQFYLESIQLIDNPGWKEHKKSSQTGDIVDVLKTEKYGKIFLVTGVVNCPPDYLFNILHNDLENIVKWNPLMLESKCIKKINDQVDITYQVTSGGGKGAVKPRDFVNLRYATKSNGRYASVGVSIEYPGYPPTKYMRGENKIGTWLISELPNKSESKFQWLIGIDLKGWIPQYVSDIALPTAGFEFLQNLRPFIEKMRSQNAF